MEQENYLDEETTFTRNIPLFYTFFFNGINEPIVLEANDKASALQMITLYANNQPLYRGAEIVNEKVSAPIYGISTKLIGNELMIWAGFEYSPIGWVPKRLFDKSLENR